MAYDFDTRLDRLGRRKKQLTAIKISYEDHGIHLQHILANRGETQQQELETSQPVDVYFADFICDSADFTFLGKEFIPREGAFIYDENTEEKFMILSELGMQHYKYTTATKKRIRIHTKRVAL